jgi:hypothetical protein
MFDCPALISHNMCTTFVRGAGDFCLPLTTTRAAVAHVRNAQQIATSGGSFIHKFSPTRDPNVEARKSNFSVSQLFVYSFSIFFYTLVDSPLARRRRKSLEWNSLGEIN